MDNVGLQKPLRRRRLQQQSHNDIPEHCGRQDMLLPHNADHSRDDHACPVLWLWLFNDDHVSALSLDDLHSTYANDRRRWHVWSGQSLPLSKQEVLWEGWQVRNWKGLL